MTIETPPVLDDEEQNKERAQQLRHEKKQSFLDIQAELLMFHFGPERKQVSEQIKNNPEEINKFYTNFDEAFFETAFYKRDFLEKIEERPDEIKDAIEKRIQLLETLEDHLFDRFQKKHEETNKTEKTSNQWSEDYVHVLTKILHNNPSILKNFEEAQDKEPQIQEQILTEIESKLY